MFNYVVEVIAWGFIIICYNQCNAENSKSIAWNGGPLHMESEHTLNVLISTGQYVKENIVATKAHTFNNEIYVITPRLKTGIPATVWQIMNGRSGGGVQLAPFPDLSSHTVAQCHGIQNAIDFFLDQLGTLWILDSGIVDILESPRCTCQPKVVAINVVLGKITKTIDLSSLTEPISTIQNVVVDYGLGSPWVYVSDAARGVVLVYDTSATCNSEWTLLVSAPSAALQLVLVPRAPAHNSLVLSTVTHEGLLQVETGSLRKKSTSTLQTLTVESKPVLLLGGSATHVYLRHAGCADVLAWPGGAGGAGSLTRVHSSGPHLTPTSVSPRILHQDLMLLETDNSFHTNLPVYHRITYIGS